MPVVSTTKEYITVCNQILDMGRKLRCLRSNKTHGLIRFACRLLRQNEQYRYSKKRNEKEEVEIINFPKNHNFVPFGNFFYYNILVFITIIKDYLMNFFLIYYNTD